jgi:cellulose synthase/poly-beta-1,6-N-acetylglucosamine synthase-like glycosyltransferase
MYMRYENWLRTLETRVGSVVGVNGGIDAVRRSLYQPMRADQLPDFVLPLRVVAQGYRVIYSDAAVSSEEALGQQEDEYRMRVRVSLRALHGLSDMRSLLSPRHGLFAFQLLVHKLLRYLLCVPLAAAFFANLALAGRPVYTTLLAAQVAGYLFAAIGWAAQGRIRFRPVFVPFYFCLINAAAGAALVRFLRGERQVLWTPRQGA